MQNTFSNALSAAVSKHIPLSATRRETLAWLALLIMRQGTSANLAQIIVFLRQLLSPKLSVNQLKSMRV